MATTPGNGNGALAKTLASYGVTGFIALYLLGAVPGMPSPMNRLFDAMAVHADALAAHHAVTLQSMRLQKLICRGVWQGNAAMQEACGE